MKKIPAILLATACSAFLFSSIASPAQNQAQNQPQNQAEKQTQKNQATKKQAPDKQNQLSFGNDAPIDVTANRAVYRGSTTILIGKVRVKQGDSLILADQMDLFRAKSKTKSEDGFVKLGNINRIVAKGHFKYTTPQNSVSGDKGVYERDKGIITVTGNVVYTTNSGNTVRGKKMIYDLKTNRARVAGDCTGRECAKSDRVMITLGKDRRSK